MLYKSNIKSKGVIDIVSNMHLGSALRKIRRSQNLTAKEVAKELGIRSDTVTKYENGQKQISHNILERMSLVYKVSIASIYALANDMGGQLIGDTLSQLSLGEKIKRIRLLENITQKEFGERIGVSRRSILMYENEGKKPSLSTLVRIGMEFKVSLDWLLNCNAQEVVSLVALTEEQKNNVLSLIQVFKNMNNEISNI